MTTRWRMRIVWGVLLAALLGGAWIIVARNGSGDEAMSAAGYVH